MKQINQMNANKEADPTTNGETGSGDDAFMFERETLNTRISSLEDQLKMQQEHEEELRAQNESLQTNVRNIERVQTLPVQTKAEPVVDKFEHVE